MRFLSLQILVALSVFGLCFTSCTETGSLEPEQKNDSLVRHLDVPRFDINTVTNSPGIAGVFDVPEMLSLCRLDSAKMNDVSGKVIEGFAILEKDMIDIGAELGGPQGMIYYNNDPNNFKFETVLLIKKMPTKTPRNCQIVVLEASYMLIYNYIGPYEGVSKSYEVIKKYLEHNHYSQSGPAREFYPQVQESDNDSSKLVTRIMVPVVKKKN